MKKIKVLVITCLMLMLMSYVVQAAVPANTIVIGNKAFDILYLVSGQHDDEIQKALDSLQDPLNEVYFKLEGDSSWTNLFDDSKKFSDEQLGASVTNVTYYDADGNTQSVAVNDNGSNNDDLTVISIE